MAGYIIYSLDWNRFEQFVKQPTDQQLLAFADLFSQAVEADFDELDEEDPVKNWPVEPEELAPHLKAVLSQDNWYGGFSDAGKQVFERTLQNFCMEGEHEMGFDVESDGVYWDVIELICAHHGVRAETITDKAISHFGNRPFRYVPERGRETRDFWQWNPMHSMQTPEEVRQLLAEIREAEQTVLDSGREDAIRDYEDELVPAVTNVAEKNRVLFIGVDT